MQTQGIIPDVNGEAGHTQWAVVVVVQFRNSVVQ